MRWGSLIVLAALAGAGCFGPDMGARPDIARLTREDPPAPPPEVDPAGVTEKNFRDKLDQLEAEIAHAEKSAP